MSTVKADYNSDIISADCPIEHPAIVTSEDNSNGIVIDTHEIPSREENWDGIRNSDIKVISNRIVQLEKKTGELGWDPNAAGYTEVAKTPSIPAYSDALGEVQQEVVHGTGVAQYTHGSGTSVGLANGDTHRKSLAVLQRAVVDLATRLGVALPSGNAPVSSTTVSNFVGTSVLGQSVETASTLTTPAESNAQYPAYFDPRATLSQAIISVDYALKNLALKTEEEITSLQSQIDALSSRIDALEAWRATVPADLSTTLANLRTDLDNHIKTLVNSGTPSGSIPATVHGTKAAAGFEVGSEVGQISKNGASMVNNQLVLTMPDSSDLRTVATLPAGMGGASNKSSDCKVIQNSRSPSDAKIIEYGLGDYIKIADQTYYTLGKWVVRCGDGDGDLWTVSLPLKGLVNSASYNYNIIYKLVAFPEYSISAQGDNGSAGPLEAFTGYDVRTEAVNIWKNKANPRGVITEATDHVQIWASLFGQVDPYAPATDLGVGTLPSWSSSASFPHSGNASLTQSGSDDTYILTYSGAPWINVSETSYSVGARYYVALSATIMSV